MSEVRKTVVFNSISDEELLKHLKGKKFSTYVKTLIEKDMNGETTTAEDVLKYILSRGLNVGAITNPIIQEEQKIEKPVEEKIEEPVVPDYGRLGGKFGGFNMKKVATE